MKVGIIDSGIGGKGIEKEIKKLLPEIKTIYLADSKNFPYGTKKVSELNQILANNVNILIEKNVDLIVLACNSGSVSSLEYLRKNFELPIIGVVPAIKMASEKTKTKNIALFSTPVTSKSKIVAGLIKDYCKGIKVYKIYFKYLAEQVEEGKIKEAQENIQTKWQDYKTKNIDTIILGCTHYVLIKDEIQKIVGPKIKLVDSNLAVARRVKSLYNKIYSKERL